MEGVALKKVYGIFDDCTSIPIESIHAIIEF
jgi:hypothetical protein